MRPDSSFRDHVTADGSSGYPAEAGRYHLYVSLACPWAHRTIIVRRLVGETATEADWRLFTTLVRFDPVYVTHFRCDRRRIVDYVALSGYLRDLYTTPGVAETVDFDQIRRHYFLTHRELNPRGILPIGPELDLEAPHGRASLP